MRLDINIARFFNLAASQQLGLNAQELRLRALLLQEGGNYTAFSRRAVIGFSAVQADNPATKQDETIDLQQRESVLQHELSHGKFFSRNDYQQACWAFWKDALSDASRRSRRTQHRNGWKPSSRARSRSMPRRSWPRCRRGTGRGGGRWQEGVAAGGQARARGHVNAAC